jgi:decaprenylphospho-beta-D-ribofuranose 2-oxidase
VASPQTATAIAAGEVGGAERAGALPPIERLSGWGGPLAGESRVLRPSTEAGIFEALEIARRHGWSIGLRGAGQSYGDASLASGNLSLDLSRMRRVLEWDPSAGCIRVEPGVTIRELWQYVVEDGWWPAVVPGTSHASIGGCAAANIHGKNAWRVGPLGEHVDAVELLLASGERRILRRETDGELLRAVIGGFGLLGVIAAVTLRLKRVHSGLLDVTPFVARDLGEMIDLFADRVEQAAYLVGWVDVLARGSALGRGLVHEARHLEPGVDPEPHRTLRRDFQELPDTIFGIVPKSRLWIPMRALFNPLGMRLVNAGKYWSAHLHAGKTFRQPHAEFQFLLDYVPDWKRAYGPFGMIQYQSFVPERAAEQTFRAKIELAHRRGLRPFLGVFKRHRRDDFLLTHGVDGFSLALEFQVTQANRAKLWGLAAELDDLVVGAGGRFYLAKDSTLRPQSFRSFMGGDRIDRFLAWKRELDPENRFQTDLFRRVFPAA